MARLQSRSPTSNTRGPDSITKNAASSFVAQMTTASLTAVLTLFLARALGATQYGLFAVAISVSTIAISLADLGISSSTARFVAEHRGGSAELPALIADALKLKLVLTGLACALLAALASVIAGVYGDPQLVWPLRAIALATFGQSTFLMLSYVAIALGRAVVNVRLVAVESVLEISASVALVLAGAGATGAAFGRAIGYVFGAALAAGVVLRLSGHPLTGFWGRPRRSIIRQVGMYARSTFAIDVSYTLSASLSVLLVGAYAGAAASGIFQAPAKLIVLIAYVGASVSNGVAPRLARGPGQEPNVDAMGRALRSLILFQCLMLAPAVVWAAPIIHLLLGRGYSQSANVLRALAPYIFFCGLAPLVTTSVNYMGEAGRRVPIALATLALVAAGGLILIPSDGVVGAAIATDIAFAFYTLAHVWLCRRLLQLRIRGLFWSLACGLTAAAAMGIVLWSVGTKDLTISDWLLGGLGGLATYVAILILTRQIRSADIARAAATVSARLKRQQPAPGTRWSERASGPAAAPESGDVSPASSTASERAESAISPSAAARSEPRIRDRLGAGVGAASRALGVVLGIARARVRSGSGFVATPARGNRSPAATPPAWLGGHGLGPDELEEASVEQRSPAADRPLAEGLTMELGHRPAMGDRAPRDRVSPAVPRRRRHDPSRAAPVADRHERGVSPAGDREAGERRMPDATQPPSLSKPTSSALAGENSSAAVNDAGGRSSLSGAAPHTAGTPGSRMDVVYQIAWRLRDDTGVFELCPVELPDGVDRASGAPSPTEQSPPIPWRWRIAPAPLAEARHAHATLVNRLLATGWRRAGAGDAWFAHLFRPPQSPPVNDR